MSGFIAAGLLFATFASLIALLVFAVIGYRIMQAERREWSGRVLLAHEEERATLARELHDAMVPALGGLALKANMLDAELGAALSRLGMEVREISHGLYPSVLDHGGLAAALRDLVDEWPYETPTLHLASPVCTPDEAELTDEQANTAYRVVQAALANAVQHAGARAVVLEFRCEDGRGIVTITDNGRGWRPRRSGSGLGWRTMQERAVAIGGHVEAVPAPGGGTMIILRFPLGAT